MPETIWYEFKLVIKLSDRAAPAIPAPASVDAALLEEAGDFITRVVLEREPAFYEG